MLWIVLVSLIFGGTLVFLFFLFGKKQLTVERQLKKNLKVIEEEHKTKEGLLTELAQLSLGLATEEQYDELGKRLEEVEESIRSEKGRRTITEAELEAIDTRLRELEELKRELEVSNMDAIKELDMLRSQERDITAKNESLRGQLETSLEQLDLLMDMLQSSAEAVERLTTAKGELIETEKKCSYYEEQIATINGKYMTLKKAYDALDIEYAQLYEKQQATDDL